MTEGTGATPSLEGSRVLARYMREHGFTFEYLEVNGDHGGMVPMVWPRVFEHSPGNKFTPNPKATVYYGDQTWEEMHFPSYGVVVDDIRLAQKDVVAAGGFVGGGGAPAPPR